MPSLELPRHSRKMPEEWPALLATTDHLLARASRWHGSLRPAAPNLLKHLMTLDPEVMERNRFYGLGIVTCHFVRAIQSQEGHQLTVNRVSQLIAQRSLYNARRSHAAVYEGLRVDDLIPPLPTRDGEPKPPLPPLDTLRIAIDRSLNPTLRLLSNGLSAAAFIRQSLLLGYMDQAKDSRNRFTGDDGHATHSVSHNMIGGGSSLLWLGLTLSGEAQGLEPNPLLAEVADDAQLADMVPLHTALNGSRVRMDEFNKAFFADGGIISVTDGQLVFHRKQLPAQPVCLVKLREQENHPPTLHESRLFCPALQVDGAIALANDLMPPIIDATQDAVAPYLGQSPSYVREIAS